MTNRPSIAIDWQSLSDQHTQYFTSPAFGGGTANSEFELFCRVPALRLLATVDFNLFTGSKSSCLPSLLSKQGFQTFMSNAFSPAYFNAIHAYQSLGFDQQFYPSRYMDNSNSYIQLTDNDHTHMLDEQLYQQNLKFVEQQLKEKPILNYVLTIYGHYPHPLRLNSTKSD